MSDINVTAHGINPETGEYLSPAERKALFKKGKMGSKVDPSVFKSGVVSGVKAAQNVRQKAEADVGDFVQQERWFVGLVVQQILLTIPLHHWRFGGRQVDCLEILRMLVFGCVVVLRGLLLELLQYFPDGSQ